MVLKPFSLTFVRYEEGDRAGYLLALISLAPIFIMVMYATLIIARRELIVIVLLVGQVLNDALNLTLKAIVNEERPLGSDREDAGMPSRHSQFMAFFCVSCLVILSRRIQIDRPLEKLLAITALGSVTLGVLVSRVYLGYHTVPQVMVGTFIGTIVAVVWDTLTLKVFARYFDAIQDTKLAKALLIKDCAHIPNVLKFEYDNAMRERKIGKDRKSQ